MNARLARNLIACLVVVLILSLLLLTGCTTPTHKYDITSPDGGQVIIESRLEFEQVEADFRRNDNEVHFRFRAGSATATPWLDEETVEAIKIIISERLP
jgi:hypothetical protein